MKNLKTEITKIHYNKEAKGAFVKILEFASIFYGIGSGLKNILYDRGYLKPKKVDAFVVSVGNITTGGVGKTPVVAEIAKYFIEKGKRTAIISRGYGGKLSNKQINLISDGEKIYYNANLAGDEPYWLAQHCKGAAVLTCSNRAKAAQFAKKELHCTKLILDDGFQHQKLERDLNILVVDSEKQFSNGCVLPLGALREPMTEIKRADKIIVVNKNFNDKKARTFARYLRKKYNKPSFVCSMEPDEIYNIVTGKPLDETKAVIAFSAIAQPEQFYKYLRRFDIMETKDFPDHHIYGSPVRHHT